MDRGLGWFKHGIQYDAKCNGLAANGDKAKPCITVFAKDKSDAISLAIKELGRYGYTNLTVDHIVRIG